jgi:hypothetical protein
MGRGDRARMFFQLIRVEQLTAKRNRWRIGLDLAVMVAFRSRDELDATRQHILNSCVWHLVGATRLKHRAPIAHWPLKNGAILRAEINQLHTEMATGLRQLGGKLKLITQCLNNDRRVQATRTRACDQRAKLG